MDLFGLADGLDLALIDAMNAVILGALAFAQPYVQGGLSLLVVIMMVMTMFGQVSSGDFIKAAVIAVCVATIMQVTNYNTYVRDLFFTTLPNEIAAHLGGSRLTLGTPEQFRQLWSAVLHATAILLQQATGFFNAPDRALAKLFAMLDLIALMLMYLAWYVPRLFLAVAICIGPFAIPFYLFQPTRGYAEQWIGKLVGLTFLQISISVVLRILLVVVNQRIRAMQNISGLGIDEMQAALMGICGVLWAGAVVMLALPVFMFIGGAVGGAVSATTGLLASLPWSAARSAARAGRPIPRPART